MELNSRKNLKGVDLLLAHALESLLGVPGGSDGKEYACSVGEQSLIPGLERSPGEGNGNTLQYSCLENPMDRGAKSQTQLSDFQTDQ